MLINQFWSGCEWISVLVKCLFEIDGTDDNCDCFVSLLSYITMPFTLVIIIGDSQKTASNHFIACAQYREMAYFEHITVNEAPSPYNFDCTIYRNMFVFYFPLDSLLILFILFIRRFFIYFIFLGTTKWRTVGFVSFC